jgi:hypothetical protein
MWNQTPASRLSCRAGAMGAVMADHWRYGDGETDMMRGIGEDDATYAAGWAVSGIATLATIVAVWVFAI